MVANDNMRIMGEYNRLPQGPYAYVTLLTRDGYLRGVQVLARSLRIVHGRYPLIVLHTGTLSPDSLATLCKEGCYLHQVPAYLPKTEEGSKYAWMHYTECWNKLHMWRLEQYSKVVYLDADMIVLRNLDHLFKLEDGFWAACDCYHGRDAEEEHARCPHYQAADGVQGGAYFNAVGLLTNLLLPSPVTAGFFVMSPDSAELSRFEAALSTPEAQAAITDYAEQDFLNWYYAATWRRLPYTYNAQTRIEQAHPELWRLKDVHIVHYNVTNKPWSADDDPHPLWQYWRHMFNHVPALHATVQPTKPVGTTAAAAAAAAASRGMPSATALPGMQPATVPPMRAVA
eukprot:jgi/Chrzof1/13235/Cz07g25200.t1